MNNNKNTVANNINTSEFNWLLDAWSDELRAFAFIPAPGDEIVVGVHDGVFHADEVLSLVLLEQLWAERELPYIRTRDPQLLADTLRVDVGEGPLDHHGPRAEAGVAACTRVFDALVRGGFVTAAEEAELRPIVSAVAAWDCGDDSQPHPMPYISALSRAATAIGEDMDSAFETALCMARQHVGAVIMTVRAAEAAKAAATAIIEEAGKIAVFPASCRAVDVKKMMWEAKVSTVFYISPESENDWRILCCANTESVEYSPFDSLRLLPEKFRGLRGDALSEATGIPGAIFCHAAGFIAGFDTKESAIKFAELCIK